MTRSEAPIALPFDLDDWIEANADAFAPPVSNKVVWSDADHIFMVIRGPNARSDFHVDPFDEIFMQIRGSIRVDLMVDGERQQKWVHEGQLMLVPAHVPHSPLRPAGTWGVVIERPRAPADLDSLVWFCDECGEEIRRVTFHMSDIEVQLAEALTSYAEDATLRTCPNGHVNPIPDVFAATPPATKRPS